MTSRRGSTTLLTVLALVSGSCALGYEVLFVRALTSVLGDMFYVHAALLSTFLVGVGLGAKTAHHWRRFLWAFEILTGLYALGLPPAVKGEVEEDGSYLVGHSAYVLAFTSDNLAHLLYPFGTRQVDWASDLPKLVAENWE